MKSSPHYTWSVIFLILLFSGNAIAQESKGDKLRELIAKESNDTSKVKLLISLANFTDDNSEELRSLKEALDISKKKKFRYGLAYGQYYEGLLLYQAGRYEEAIEKYKKCIDILDSLHVKQTMDCPLSSIRLLFIALGKQEEKFRYYYEKLLYYKKHGPVENTADCLHGIAGYYVSISDYDKAIEYYLRALSVYKTFDSLGSVNEKMVVGSCYIEWGNLDKGEEALKQALSDLFRLKLGPSEFFFCYQMLGFLYADRHNYHQALQYYHQAKQYCTSPLDKAVILVNCAEVYLEMNAKDSARINLLHADKIRKKEKLDVPFTNAKLDIEYVFYKYYLAVGNKKMALKSLECALLNARLAHFLPTVLKYTNELHSFLLNRGDSLQALRYLLQYHTIRDSLNAMNTRARIANFEIEQQQQEKDNEIEQLRVQKAAQRNYYLIGGVLLLLIVIGVITAIIYKRKRDKEQLTTDFKKQLAQAETKALRAQMNPHFIFNSLNSINSFVMDQKHEIASDYLIKFSKLIRLILDNSRSETISIEKELETLKLYVVLEAVRFDNKFKCVYQIAENVDINSIKIPPMLLQPFVENAIWHGLMQKEGNGTITIDISMNNEQITDNSEQIADNSEQLLRITITDNGIGREKAAELKSKSATHKSHGLKVTSQRIEMMNKLNSTGAKVNIIDLKDSDGNATGTRVELIIPL